MSIDINAAQFLVAAKKKGASFGSVLMVGRQNLNIFPKTTAALLERNQLPAEKFKNPTAACTYSEPFFESLGSTQVDSLDYSPFEGAQLVHDLNTPIPAAWQGKYDVVYDGGTLEHVFNFPTALKNSMDLVRVGGRFFSHSCANNLCGHGFYQLSPELFYRTLSPENGFEVERIVIHRVGPYGSWREISDPNAIRARVELITFTPVLMLVQARRIAIKPIFEKPPLQSDYSALWQASPVKAAKAPKNNFPVLRRFWNAAKTGIEFYHRQSLFNRLFFKKVKRED